MSTLVDFQCVKKCKIVINIINSSIYKGSILGDFVLFGIFLNF